MNLSIPCIGIVTLAAVATPQAAFTDGLGDLRVLVDEYQQASRAYDVTPETYEKWLARFNQVAERVDSDVDSLGAAALGTYRRARAIQLTLANGEGRFDLAEEFAIDLIETAPDEANAAHWWFQLGQIRWYLRMDHQGEGSTKAVLEAFGKGLAEMRRALANDPDIRKHRGLLGTSLTASFIMAQLINESGNHPAVAAAILLDADARARQIEKVLELNEPFPGAHGREELLEFAMHSLVAADEIDQAERVLDELSSLPLRRKSPLEYLVSFAQLESPNGGPQFQERLRNGLEAHKDDPARKKVILTLAQDFLQHNQNAKAERVVRDMINDVGSSITQDPTAESYVREGYWLLTMALMRMERFPAAREAAASFVRLASENDHRVDDARERFQLP